MKVFLDDERPAPVGWIRTSSISDVISLLKSGCVTDLSLDHDLGNDERGTGYDVVTWIEREVATRKFIPPKITVHTANISARIKMEAGVTKIESFVESRRLKKLRRD